MNKHTPEQRKSIDEVARNFQRMARSQYGNTPATTIRDGVTITAPEPVAETKILTAPNAG